MDTDSESSVKVIQLIYYKVPITKLASLAKDIRNANNTHMHVKYDFPNLYHRWSWQVNLAVRKKKELRHVSYTSKEWVTWNEVHAYISLNNLLRILHVQTHSEYCDKNKHTSISNLISWMLSLVLFSTISIFFSEYTSFFFTVSIFFGFWWLIYLLAPVTFYHLLHR